MRPPPGINLDEKTLTAPLTNNQRTTDKQLIIHIDIKIKDLISLKERGKDYPWPRPPQCPCCGGKLWSHGYTPRYFPGSSTPFYLKRYRCTECRAVHTLRPKDHWRRFQAECGAILDSLRSKMLQKRWIPGFTRQRQQYWFRGLKTQFARDGPAACLLTFKRLRKLLAKNVIVATHSLRWFRMIARPPFFIVPPAA